MLIQKINNDMSFGMKDINGRNFKFKLSDATLNAISKSTGLTIDELHRLPLDEATKLMKERGTLKEPSKLWQWLSDTYRKFGEKTGLLKKEYPIYSDGD
jgi:hypothetical protein